MATRARQSRFGMRSASRSVSTATGQQPEEQGHDEKVNRTRAEHRTPISFTSAVWNVLTRISRMRRRTGDAGQRIVYGDQYVIASSVASACLIQRVNR